MAGSAPYAPEYGGPAAEPLLLDRLAYGAYVAHHTGLPILVSGNGIEASAMRDTLARNFGIEPRWVEDRSYDTFDNASNSAQMLRADGVQRIVLVTSADHLWRAAQEFTAAGLEVMPAPAGMWADRDLGVLRYLPEAQAADALLLGAATNCSANRCANCCRCHICGGTKPPFRATICPAPQVYGNRDHRMHLNRRLFKASRLAGAICRWPRLREPPR